MNDLVKRGSKTARDGFKNENDVVDKFNNWQNDDLYHFNLKTLFSS